MSFAIPLPLAALWRSLHLHQMPGPRKRRPATRIDFCSLTRYMRRDIGCESVPCEGRDAGTWRRFK